MMDSVGELCVPYAIDVPHGVGVRLDYVQGFAQDLSSVMIMDGPTYEISISFVAPPATSVRVHPVAMAGSQIPCASRYASTSLVCRASSCASRAAISIWSVYVTVVVGGTLKKCEV